GVTLRRWPTHASRRPPLPLLLTSELPLGGHETTVVIPPTPSFPVGERLRMPSSDVNKPADLPPMAQPVVDRPSFSDPTLPASRESVLSATMPERKNQAPFLRLALPAPFGHRDTVV